MKFFRYRRPSWKTILGLTQAKKQVKKALGITALLKPFRWWTNLKRWFKCKIGDETSVGQILRNAHAKPPDCQPAMISGAEFRQEPRVLTDCCTGLRADVMLSNLHRP